MFVKRIPTPKKNVAILVDGIVPPTAVNVCPRTTHDIEMKRIPSKQLKCSELPGVLAGRTIWNKRLVFE